MESLIAIKTKLIKRLSDLHGQPFVAIHKSQTSSYLVDRNTKLIIDLRIVGQSPKYIQFKIKVKDTKHFIKYYFKKKAFYPSVKQLYNLIKQDIESLLQTEVPAITFDINFWSIQTLYYAGPFLAPCTLLALKTYPFIRFTLRSSIQNAMAGKDLNQEVLDTLLSIMKKYICTINANLYRDLFYLQLVHSKSGVQNLVVALPVNDSVFHIKLVLKDLFLKKEINEDKLYNFLFYVLYLGVTDFIKATLKKLIPSAIIVRQSEALTSKYPPPFVKEIQVQEDHVKCIFKNDMHAIFTNRHEISAFSLMLHLRPDLINRALILAKHDLWNDVTFIRHKLASFVVPITHYREELMHKLSQKWYLNAEDMFNFIMGGL